MYVVSFIDFQPEPRYDGVAWARVTIDESAAEAGPFVQIDSQMLNPIDTDPANPMTRSFTTDNATLPSGWYRVTFHDASGNDQGPVAPIHRAADKELSYTPTVTQVAQKILSRTRDQYGNDVGLFTTETKPTADQVHQLALAAAGKLSLKIGDDIPDELIQEASDLAALRTAMDVELTYFSDQVATGRSIYAQLKDQYEEELSSLTRAITLTEEGTGIVVDSGATFKPQWSFTQDDNGWMTRRW